MCIYIYLYRRVGCELTATNQDPGIIILSPMKTHSVLTSSLISMKCVKVLGIGQEQNEHTLIPLNIYSQLTCILTTDCCSEQARPLTRSASWSCLDMWVVGVAKREPKHTTEEVVLNSSIRQVMQSKCFCAHESTVAGSNRPQALS